MKKICILFIALITLNIANAQWEKQVCGTNNNLRSVYFLDANTGYVVGDYGTILKTTDGGIDWITLMNDTTISLCSVFFTDYNIGYSVGTKETILKTIDGGATWTAQSSGLTDGLNLYSIYFPAPDTGYVVGESSILKTIDGGRNWTRQSKSTFSPLFSCFFIDTKIGYAVGGDGAIIKTTNGGDNWDVLVSYKQYSLHSVFFTDSLTGYVCGGSWLLGRQMLKTVNGGIDWTYLNCGGTNMDLQSIYFSDKNTGFMVGYGSILKTSDGGTNWTVQSDINGGNSVFFTDNNTGYIVGYGILKTLNGGLGLEEMNKGETFNVFPNLARDIITINFPQIEKERILTIYNINGKELMRQQINVSNTQIDISNLVNGIYFIKLNTDKTVEVRKIIKV
jgi:photosystem II stability/assembly factor-like uncharacterized protein